MWRWLTIKKTASVAAAVAAGAASGGAEPHDEGAVVNGASEVAGAVLASTLTTIAGLLPILLETSFQAQFLIPMAISTSVSCIAILAS